MKILYIDCPMGISGDMFLAALIDLGVSPKILLGELKKLGLGPIKVNISKETRHSITATCFRVPHAHEHRHRTFKDIKKIIAKSKLSKEIKDLSVDIFKKIAEAEARVHGIGAEEVHFHEVGAMDSIIDIVGAATATAMLRVDRIVSSAIPLGSGWTKTMHGVLPIPAPATLELLKGVPIASSDVTFELTTPTGAAIIKTLSSNFGPMPEITVEKIGYGAGKKDFQGRANVLRAVIGTAPDKHAQDSGGFRMIETNIDDMSPQIAGHLMDVLFAAGALDVYFTPVQMKKSRPGILLSALVEDEKAEAVVNAIFMESTSIGLRTYPVERHCLKRKTVKALTPYGAINFKISMRNGIVTNVQPEYEDCKKIASKKGVPLKEIIDAAKAAYGKKAC